MTFGPAGHVHKGPNYCHHDKIGNGQCGMVELDTAREFQCCCNRRSICEQMHDPVNQYCKIELCYKEWAKIETGRKYRIVSFPCNHGNGPSNLKLNKCLKALTTTTTLSTTQTTTTTTTTTTVESTTAAEGVFCAVRSNAYWAPETGKHLLKNSTYRGCQEGCFDLYDYSYNAGRGSGTGEIGCLENIKDDDSYQMAKRKCVAIMAYEQNSIADMTECVVMKNEYLIMCCCRFTVCNTSYKAFRLHVGSKINKTIQGTQTANCTTTTPTTGNNAGTRIASVAHLLLFTALLKCFIVLTG